MKVKKKDFISLFLVPGCGKGVGMDYEALSWWTFKTENQQTSLIGFTLDFCICCHQSLTQLLGWIMKLFPSMQGKESANFNPGSTSNMLTKVYRVAFCSCNLLNPLEVVICKFWVNYTTNSWKEMAFSSELLLIDRWIRLQLFWKMAIKSVLRFYLFDLIPNFVG